MRNKQKFDIHWLFNKIAALGLIPTLTLFNAVQQPHVNKIRTAMMLHGGVSENESINKDEDEFDSFWIDIGGEG